MDNLETLLNRLMARLDENDRRYGDALNDLNQRISELANRTQAANRPSQTSGDALNRVHEQASALAEQVNQAGNSYRQQQDTGNARDPRLAQQDNPHSAYLDDSRLTDDFANVTSRLEESLAARGPAGDVDLLSQRMDELMQRLDTALSAHSDPQALQTIESQLGALNAGFAQAQENYARVETIQDQLASLINWARSNDQSSDQDRLGAIEQTLRALEENAREMDARTVGTLEAMNEVLHSLAANIGSGQTPPAPRDARMEVEDNESVQEAVLSEEPHYAEVSIEEQEPGRIQEQLSENLEDLGQEIPDYQPPPARGEGKSSARKQAADQRVEPTFSSKPENDFIASARRAAAAAAAQQSPPRPAKASGRKRPGLPGMLTPQPGAQAGGTRKTLAYAAVALLLASAGLLYARLSTKTEMPASMISRDVTPELPQKAPKPGSDKTSSNQLAVPSQPPATKKQTDRMPVRNSEPAPFERAAAPSRQENRPPQAPVPSRIAQPAKQDGPLSTATLLASLPPNDGKEETTGVTMTIKEPAARSATAPAAPALVPQTTQSIGSQPLAQPKKAPPSKRKNTASAEAAAMIDSAKAFEIAPAESAPRGAMPPARIGPASLRMAAARGNPAAQVEIASRYAKGVGVPKDLKQAVEWYKKAASQGYAPGQYRLAALYERGHGVTKDTGMARTWYRRAAELGNVRAMHNLAVLNTRSDDRKADYVSARNWFHQAARHGLADSQFNLGILYESGLGVTANIAEAYKWYTLAARQGDAEAKKRRETIRLRLPAKSLKAVEQTLQRWKAAKPRETANRVGPPRGGWQNAKIEQSSRSGDTAIIARAQHLLNKLGYDAGIPDGKIGPQTLSALRRFEARTGTGSNGKIDATLIRRLEALNS